MADYNRLLLFNLGDTRLRLPSDCNHLEASSHKKEWCLAKNEKIESFVLKNFFSSIPSHLVWYLRTNNACPCLANIEVFPFSTLAPHSATFLHFYVQSLNHAFSSLNLTRSIKPPFIFFHFDILVFLRQFVWLDNMLHSMTSWRNMSFNFLKQQNHKLHKKCRKKWKTTRFNF